nr:retrovirus-related Pol polyprotein from transposon TNT 1-94 [Tanacetum cinerariifolium]
MQKRRNDVKVRTTLLLALPDEHQLRFSKYETAKELWEAILKTFGGNEATKKTKKNQLKQQYGNFKAEGSKTLEKTFNILHAIVSHLDFMDVEIEQDDLNQKFLTSLTPEWLIGKGEVHNASIPTASTQVSTASTDIAAASLSHDTVCAYIATQSNGSQTKYEDITQIDEDDIEEMDIKWNMALLSMRADMFWKKTDKKITIQGSDVAGFDKSKVECFNCHKMGHFAREYRVPRSQYRANDEVSTEFAVMAKSSSSLKNEVEARLVECKEHKVKFCERIRGLERDIEIRDNKIEYLKNELERGNPQNNIKDKGYWDSGCSQHMTRNISYLFEYEPYDGGYVSFGHGGGKITGKGIIKTGKLKFENVYFMKELKTKDETSSIIRNFITEIENLKDLKAEAVNTACYVQNRVLVNKSQNKTPYELFNSRTPAIGFLRPFGCHVMIFNTLDHLGKFDAKGDEGYFVGYSLSSKSFRVFNKRTKKVDKNLHVDFLENKLIKKGAGPNWLFDIDTIKLIKLTFSGGLGTKDVASQDVKKDVSSLRYIALPNWFHEAHIETRNSDAPDGCTANVPESSGISNPTATSKEEPKKIFDALKDPNWVEAMKEELLQFKIQSVWILVDCLKGEEGIDYEEVFAPVASIEAIRLFLAYASFMGFIVYHMDVKSVFLYGIINEEVYVMQPLRYQDLEFPDRVYKVEKAIEFEALMHDKFQMSAMGELTFFLGLKVLQKKDGIFLSQDNVGDILKKFGYLDVRSANTLMDKENPWGKDGPGKDVELHLYRSMIGSLMYLIAFRPNIMFAVYACARHQVTPKECHLYVVKRIFRYLKDSDYGGATQDRKSIIGGCLFLGRMLISWQCKKQTIVATSTTEAEYVAAASSCGQVLWIQNQMLDYGIETMNQQTKILATIDGKPWTISKSFLRRHLKLNDEEGISSLPGVELFENLSLMGYNTLPNQRFTFQKGQFSHQWHQSQMAAKIKDQDQEISELKARVKFLENKESRSAEPTQEDAPITGGIKKIGEELRADKSTKLGTNDTEEMVNVLSSMEAVNILISGGAAASVSPGDVLPIVGVPTVSGSFPTVSAIFTTASVVTPYTRRSRGITIGSLQPMRSPIIGAKDKGKQKVVETKMPKKRKLQEQIDAQVARETEEEFARENQRLSEQLVRDSKIARLRAEEELKIMIEGLDKSNEVVAKHLGEYKQAKADLSVGEKIELISELVKYQDHRAKIIKYQAQQSKLHSKKDQKEFYMSVLKSHIRWKTKNFRVMTLEQIKEKFISIWKQLEDFVPMSSKKESKRVKRQGLKIDQGSAKRVKTSKSVSKDVSEEELKGMMHQVPLEEVYVEALQVKHPIIDWEIYSEGKREY